MWGDIVAGGLAMAVRGVVKPSGRSGGACLRRPPTGVRGRRAAGRIR
jgi:hypothetical protein